MEMNSAAKHILKHKDVQPRQKRFKVGKACFTCRVKKIKCDGLQPCMQCKARSRPCSFSKDGETDSTDEQDENSNHASPAPSPISSPILVNQISPKTNLLKRTISNSTENELATEILNRLSAIVPEGDLTTLRGIKLKQQPPRQPHVQPKVDLPTKSVQLDLIQLYFKHCYSTFPMIPKKMFYKHFNSASSKLLSSPFLLLMIFAHGAQYQPKTFIQADSFFDSAKLLLEHELHHPNLSTVVALVLMSLYESSENQCVSMYSAMAFQMTLDLHLFRNYQTDTLDLTVKSKSNVEPNDMMELKKRVVWGCYYLDKLRHIQSGQPWILRDKDIDFDMPLLQPGDDVVEHEVLEGFVATIKLCKIAENILQQQASQPLIKLHSHDQLSINHNNELLHWLRALPSHLQWTFIPVNDNVSTPEESPSSPLVCQLHLFYNLIELYALQPYSHLSIQSIHQRSITNATNMIRLIAALSDNPSWMFNVTFTLGCLFESTKLHLQDCACDMPDLARHARSMFQRSTKVMKTLLSLDHKRNMFTTKITEFLTTLDQVLTDAITVETMETTETVTMESEMMTPFVLGSLNSRHEAEEERQQWSKLDYYANGLITPPTVKSKASLYYHPPAASSSSLVGHTSNNFLPYSTYHHSASTDNLFQSSWRAAMTPNRIPYAKSTNPLDFLSNQDPQQWPQSARVMQKSSSNNKHVKQQQTPAELLLNQTDSSEIAALVAQIRDNKEGNTSSNTSDSNQEDWNTTSNAVTSTAATAHGDDLLYSLLSTQRVSEVEQTQNHRQQQYTSFAPYPYTNVGLGIYASAHQHHNDVIRQHITTHNNTVTMPRSGILHHQGQAIIPDNNNHTTAVNNSHT